MKYVANTGVGKQGIYTYLNTTILSSEYTSRVSFMFSQFIKVNAVVLIITSCRSLICSSHMADEISLSASFDEIRNNSEEGTGGRDLAVGKEINYDIVFPVGNPDWISFSKSSARGFVDCFLLYNGFVRHITEVCAARIKRRCAPLVMMCIVLPCMIHK